MNNWLVWLLSFILPRRKWYRNYYLRSKHWRETRLKKHNELKKLACEKCKKPMWFIVEDGYFQIKGASLDIHHRYYYRNGKSILWNERPEDLQVLCRTCHNKEHERK